MNDCTRSPLVLIGTCGSSARVDSSSTLVELALHSSNQNAASLAITFLIDLELECNALPHQNADAVNACTPVNARSAVKSARYITQSSASL